MRCSVALKFTLSIAMFTSLGHFAKAQSAAPAAPVDDSGLEEIYDRFETDEDVKTTKTQQKRVDEDQAKEQKVEKQVDSISDLGKLAPFSDIAVIQRKYLPRTERFQASANLLVNTNNQFFNNVGAGLKLAYAFTEKYAVEIEYLYFASAKRDITKNLEEKQSIGTENFVEPESYIGGSLKWTPIYGKVAWFEKTIIPFEIYLTPGFGMTSTAYKESVPTFSLGGGQMFALSKATAAHWDFVWHNYSATTRVSSVETKRNQNDLLLMVGYSFLFPEAKYR